MIVIFPLDFISHQVSPLSATTIGGSVCYRSFVYLLVTVSYFLHFDEKRTEQKFVDLLDFYLGMNCFNFFDSVKPQD